MESQSPVSVITSLSSSGKLSYKLSYKLSQLSCLVIIRKQLNTSLRLKIIANDLEESAEGAALALLEIEQENTFSK